MSEVEKAIGSLIAAFRRYSGKEGDTSTLTKNELKDLLRNEFGMTLKNSNDKANIDKIFNDLDANGDQTVDFQEYIFMVACITSSCHDFLVKSTK